ncbi:MAG: type I-E CRISPR-associated protein Cse1/CasA [Chloroflexi bacterium HGW-Chloroflexi-3]|nr:MAG: type I-E CRISPR-associated protein Cse1/CasA [Chloroflexi bacterium HGW-Chloroflexi-3]
MNFSYNLISQPWIPVLTKNGDYKNIDMKECLINAQEYLDLKDPYPIVNSAIFRLLIAMLIDIFRPNTSIDFENLLKDKYKENEIENYLIKYFERFDIFDKQKPFYQISDDRVKPKPALKMVHHYASGNNATLFDHHTETDGVGLKPDQAARFLITIQAFGLSGLSGISEKFTNAPISNIISFYLKGANLFETLYLNLVSYNQDRNGFFPSDERDKPFWRLDDPFRSRNIPYGLLDYLTWMNRRIILYPEDENGRIVVRKIKEAPGLRLDEDYIDGAKIHDPFVYYRNTKDGPKPLKFRVDRALWRDSASLFRYERQDEGTNLDEVIPIETVLNLRKLIKRNVLPMDKTFFLQAVGMASDKAKILFYRSEELPLPLEYVNDRNLLFKLHSALSYAEKISHKLFGAIREFARIATEIRQNKEEGEKKEKPKLSLDGEKLLNHLNAERFYWINAERGFLNLLEMLPKDDTAAISDWIIHINSSAINALESAIALAGNSPKFLKAQVHAAKILYGGMEKLNSGKENAE